MEFIGRHHKLSQESVLSGWVLAILRAMELEGIAFAQSLEQAGIDPKRLYQGGSRFSQGEVTRLWQTARDLVRDPAFGLQVASQVRPDTFHVLGYAMSCSVDLYRALQRFAHYCRLISDAANATLIHRGDTVVLEFHFDLGKKPPIYQSYDTVLSSVVHFLRWIARSDFSPQSVCVRHTSPVLDPAFKRFFGCDIHYGKVFDSISFSRVDLDQPILGADESLAAALDGIANRELEIRMEDRFSVLVRDALVAQFALGPPSKQQTAEMLHLTERTLLRRLKEEGVTYSTLLAQLREEMAFHYIQRGDMELSEIASRLGFSEYGAFSRAFLRWTGVRPGSVERS
tara:strand:+ start:44930 stop:45955 length:1026 start_codon:yes stop_codon:yes gene_type:complete